MRNITDTFSRLIANLMLPDGAERQPADWTVFFLNQTPFNTIKPILALDNDDDWKKEVKALFGKQTRSAI